MIHWPRVTELRDEIGVDDFGEVIALFLEEVEEMIEKLRRDADRTQLEKDLHFLKGSALSLGFEDFSALCQDGERQSALGEAENVDVAAIIEGFEASRLEFERGLSDRS